MSQYRASFGRFWRLDVASINIYIYTYVHILACCTPFGLHAWSPPKDFLLFPCIARPIKYSFLMSTFDSRTCRSSDHVYMYTSFALLLPATMLNHHELFPCKLSVTMLPSSRTNIWINMFGCINKRFSAILSFCHLGNHQFYALACSGPCWSNNTHRKPSASNCESSKPYIRYNFTIDTSFHLLFPNMYMQ